MDILIKLQKSQNKSDVLAFIKTVFKPNEIYCNSNVISFNYFDFQIDFILIDEPLWEIAKHYFDYDCLGNIMGKSYHKFGLSYGWNGLWYKFRNFNGINSHNIFITADPKKIFEFGGYDYERYLKGFETLEEIYKFCIDGKYFNLETFKMENLTQIDRKRNRKRKSYHEFLNYVGTREGVKAFEFNKDKSSYLPMIDEYFPEANLIEKLDVLIEEDRINKEIASKFNGNLIMEWIPGLEGKELGLAIGKFKTRLGDRYKQYILETEIEQIKIEFLKTHYE